MVNTLPKMCMTRLNTTGEPIAIKRGEMGYWAMPGCDPDKFNTDHDVTPAQVMAMEAGSLFGWHVPGANPETYGDVTEFPYHKRVQS